MSDTVSFFLIVDMGYYLHITRTDLYRRDGGSNIVADEWVHYVKGDSELAFDPQHGDQHFVRWTQPDDNSERWFDWVDGCIETKNPDRATIRKTLQIARALGARVQGDDGEYYEDDSGWPVGQRPTDAMSAEVGGKSMKYDLELTYDEFVGGLRLAEPPSSGKRLWIYVIIGGLLCVMYPVLLEGKVNMWAVLAMVFFAGFLIYVKVFETPRLLRRAYEENRKTSEDLQYEFRQDLFCVWSMHKTTELPWQKLYKWKEGDTLFLVYEDKYRFHILPKRLFVTQEEQDRFRSLLTAVGMVKEP